MSIGLNSLQYGVLYLDSHYNTGPYFYFPHFGNSNLGKLPYVHMYIHKHPHATLKTLFQYISYHVLPMRGTALQVETQAAQLDHRFSNFPLYYLAPL